MPTFTLTVETDDEPATTKRVSTGTFATQALSRAALRMLRYESVYTARLEVQDGDQSRTLLKIENDPRS